MNLLALNDDCLIHIFCYLNLEDLKSVSFASSRLGAIIEEYLLKKIASDLVLTSRYSFSKRIFDKDLTNWSRIQSYENWKNGVYSQKSFFYHKLGPCIKMQVDNNFFYVTNRGEIRLYPRKEKEFFEDNFKSYGLESKPGISAISIKEGNIFYGTFEGNCSLVLDGMIQLEDFEIHQKFETTRFVDFNISNNILLSASHSEVKILSLVSELGLYSLETVKLWPGGYITTLKLNELGTKFVLSDLQKLILNDLESSKEIQLDCKTDGVLDIVWKDKDVLLTGHKDGSLRVFDLRTNKDEIFFFSDSNWNTSLDFDGRSGVLCGYKNSKKVNLFDLRRLDFQPISTLGPFNSIESSAVLSQIVSDGQHLFVALSFNVFGLDFSNNLF